MQTVKTTLIVIATVVVVGMILRWVSGYSMPAVTTTGKTAE